MAWWLICFEKSWVNIEILWDEWVKVCNNEHNCSFSHSNQNLWENADKIWLKRMRLSRIDYESRNRPMPELLTKYCYCKASANLGFILDETWVEIFADGLDWDSVDFTIDTQL